jgi:hypothetical protein
MIRPDPLGLVWIFWREDLDPEFQLRTLEAYVWLIRNTAEPDESVQDWFDQASQNDHEYLMWSLRVWRELRTAPAFTCEAMLREIRELRRGDEPAF